MIGFVSSVYGLFRKGATEVISLSFSNWLEVSLVLDGMNSSTGLKTIVSRGHSWKLLKNHCHCEARLQFFSQRVINRWNSLPQDMDATSVNAFKGRLERM